MGKNSDEAIEFVYQTTNYDKFSCVEFNRDVKESRFYKIKASFEEREILNPIIVNENFEIIDGQGRFEVCKELGRPIKYIVACGADINDCRRMNRYNCPWSNDDFIDSYANAGIEDYIRIRRIHQSEKVSYSVIQSIVGSGSVKFDLLNGKMKMTYEQEQFVYEVIKHSKDIKKSLMFTGRLTRQFYISIRVLLKTDGYEPSRMVEKCKFFSQDFAMLNSLESLLKFWTKVYNYKVKAVANKLYFEDYMRNKGHNVQRYDEINPFDKRNQYGESVKTLV